MRVGLGVCVCVGGVCVGGVGDMGVGVVCGCGVRACVCACMLACVHVYMLSCDHVLFFLLSAATHRPCHQYSSFVLSFRPSSSTHCAVTERPHLSSAIT